MCRLAAALDDVNPPLRSSIQSKNQSPSFKQGCYGGRLDSAHQYASSVQSLSMKCAIYCTLDPSENDFFHPTPLRQLLHRRYRVHGAYARPAGEPQRLQRDPAESLAIAVVSLSFSCGLLHSRCAPRPCWSARTRWWLTRISSAVDSMISSRQP
jgi:hypothetical protein